MVEQLDQLALAFADRHAGQEATIAAATAGHRRYRETVETVLAELVASGRPFTADDIRRAIPDEVDAEAHSPDVLPSVLGSWAARHLTKSVADQWRAR